MDRYTYRLIDTKLFRMSTSELGYFGFNNRDFDKIETYKHNVVLCDPDLKFKHGMNSEHNDVVI